MNLTPHQEEFRCSCSVGDYQKGVKMLHTYMKNIHNQPSVQKYRKIRTGTILSLFPCSSMQKNDQTSSRFECREISHDLLLGKNITRSYFRPWLWIFIITILLEHQSSISSRTNQKQTQPHSLKIYEHKVKLHH